MHFVSLIQFVVVLVSKTIIWRKLKTTNGLKKKKRLQDRRPQITAPGFHQALELQLKSRVVVSLQSTQNFLAMDTIMFGEKRDSRKRKSRHSQCKSWWWIAVRWHCYEKYHDILF